MSIPQIIKDAAGLHVVWGSLEEFDSEGRKILDKYNRRILTEVFDRHGSDSVWYGGAKNAEDGMQKIRNGWPEMLKLLNDMLGDEKPRLELAASTVQTRRRKRKRADHGDTLDMHRVWAGELDRAWERPEREYRQSISQRHATIFIDTATVCFDNAADMLWRGAAAMLICDLLTSAGRAVEIYVGGSAISTFKEHMGWFWSAIRVKEYMQPLQAERLAAMVTATFFRTYGFALICAMPYTPHSYMSVPRNEGLPVQLAERQKAGELVVRIGRCTSRAEAEREFYAVANALKKESTTHEETI